MRNQWRLLFQRCKPVSELQYKVQQSTTIPLSHHRTFHSLSPSPHIHFSNPSFTRLFSSLPEVAVEQNKILDQSVLTSALIELYSDPIKSNEDLMIELRSKNYLAGSDHVVEFFKNRGSEPGAAKVFFDWVMSKGSDNLSSNSCNRLLGMLGANGLVKEFWDLVEIMKKKGYGVKKGASVRAIAKFEEMGMEGDVQKLKDLFALGSVDASVEKFSSRVCKVIQKVPWGDDVETKLQEMGVVYSSDLVKAIVENLGTVPNKAVIFFRWIEESGLYKHDEKTYNAIVRELTRVDYMDKFWRLIDEMRAAGYDMEKATYIRAMTLLVRNKQSKEAVDLYEFAMSGNIKPLLQQDCLFLLRKIVTSDELDMDLFSKVLRIHKEGGNTLTNSILDSVLNSLTSVGRFVECNKILRSMEEVGFLPDEKLQSKIGFQLSKNSKTEEASEFLDFLKESGAGPSYKTWESLIEGYCVSRHLDKACDCFNNMIKNEGASCAGYALETLSDAYCSNGKAVEAYKLLSEVVLEKEIKPWHSTYKLLISKLLDQGSFKEATTLFAPMKRHGYPPYLGPFVKYVSKAGTTDETVMFLKAMTVKKIPSTDVYIRVFIAYFKAGRHSEAQDFLSKCPRGIRNHVDVLNLFSSMKHVKDTVASTPVAS